MILRESFVKEENKVNKVALNCGYGGLVGMVYAEVYVVEGGLVGGGRRRSDASIKLLLNRYRAIL